MKIHQLEINKKASRKRVGRGISAGKGKTSGRGTKGQKSRSGGSVKPGFEGGQTKLAQRLPKVRGFKAINGKIVQVVNVEQLDNIKADKIDAKVLKQHKLIRDENLAIKVLGNGKISRQITLEVSKISKSAQAKIEKAKGKVIIASQKTKRDQTKKLVSTKK